VPLVTTSDTYEPPANALASTSGTDREAADDASVSPAPQRRRSRRRWLAARIALLVLIAGVTAFDINLATGPSVNDAPAVVEVIDRAHGSLPEMIAPTERIAIAIVAAEDGTFYSNDGVDVPDLVRGFLGYLTGTDAGGSTIEIQLAHILYPSDTGGLWGRLHRVSLALQFDTHYTKAAILSMYLGAAYFGHGYYGIRAASLGYFGTPPGQLSWAQAALLAGLVQAPSALDPFGHLTAAVQRMGYVLQRLVSDGRLTAAQATAIARSPLALIVRRAPNGS
jgi:Transglycosylase